ncbi:MAG: hypothetical protein H6737_25115 [Alphaproteobacteria bacterium]|nr:hypothetical protein [Alphaproteobacteria bacterium]
MAAPPDDPSTAGTEAAAGPGFVGRVLRGVVAVLGLLCVGAIAGGGALVYPYVRDDLALDRVVRAVALEWRDFGREKATEKLRFELEREEVGAAVGPDACTLDEAGGVKRVACQWAVRIALPIGGSVPLSFASVAEIDPSTGDLR